MYARCTNGCSDADFIVTFKDGLGVDTVEALCAECKNEKEERVENIMSIDVKDERVNNILKDVINQVV